MIDHVTINVRDLERSKAFYEKALATLGMKLNLGSAEDFFWGFGPSQEPEFEITAADFSSARATRAIQSPPIHTSPLERKIA